MSSLDEILKRLAILEGRMARIEATVGMRSATANASNADAFAHSSTPSEAGIPKSPPPSPPASAQPQAARKTAPKAAAPAQPQRHAEPSIADAPVTERLVPLRANGDDGEDPFPDLSQLDQKLEFKKGPAEIINVRAALEDYPRIATRIQQLWGTSECEPYLNNLVIDTRGNRKGFPPAMMEELLYLGRLARALVILAVGGDKWDSYDQVGDRR